MSVLKEADKLVNNDREKDYGSACLVAERFAYFANGLMPDKRFEPQDANRCMIAMKLAREVGRHKRDNVVDLCGYLELYERLEEEAGGEVEVEKNRHLSGFDRSEDR